MTSGLAERGVLLINATANKYNVHLVFSLSQFHCELLTTYILVVVSGTPGYYVFGYFCIIQMGKLEIC